MGRPVTDDDIGLKVLREAPVEAESAQIIDIVAIHGLGAHPDDSWCKNVGTRESSRWVNWLEEENMLPEVVPSARIMRYGYKSDWFGKGAMQQSVPDIADRLLRALMRKREGALFEVRPLLFVAHCFGGLVVLNALVEAEQNPSDWPGVFSATIGLVFFGTPFRGAEGMDQIEMREAAQRKYDNDQVQHTTLEVLQPGNVYLEYVVENFLKKLRRQASKMQIACFYELILSNVGRIVGGQDRMRFVVSRGSGWLDLSDTIKKYPLPRTHYDMNKFGTPTEEDFETVADVVKEMINTHRSRSSMQQTTLGTKRHCPEPIQVRDNKRACQYKCYGCHGIGHLRRQCPERSKDKCYNCGEIGHWGEDCFPKPYADGDRDEQLEDSEEDDDEESESEDDDEESESEDDVEESESGDDDEDVEDDSDSEDEFGEGYAEVFGCLMSEGLSPS